MSAIERIRDHAPAWALLSACLFVLAPGCGDDGGSGETGTGTGDGDGDGDGDSGDGDGDGDGDSGDGDGDSGDGDGDSGDGDGDSGDGDGDSGDGDGDTGDGDGDTGDGDGDTGDGDGDTGDGDGDSGDGDGDTGDGDGDTGDGDGDPGGPLDMLLVIDNSADAALLQSRLAAQIPGLIADLAAYDVHLMVTTTDIGHPSCSPFQPDDYDPAQGSPVTAPCVDHLDWFTPLGQGQPMPEICTTACPVGVAPEGDYLAFDGQNDNVADGTASEALACMVPVGIIGCGFESPLESMLQALNPGAPWNQGLAPFLREEAALSIVVLSSEFDCSVRFPNGYSFFLDDDTYWPINPDTNTKTNATSATCFLAGASCGPVENGAYAGGCTLEDTGALHPITRYTLYLDQLAQQRPVSMTVIGGVPTLEDGGLESLVYRPFEAGAYPQGDELPGGDDVAGLEYRYGIGPGCTYEEDGQGLSHATPPTRAEAVCAALGDDNCCVRSVCAGDYADALGCALP